MKHKPITEPEFIGCLNCQTKETPILDPNRQLFVYGWLTLKIDDKCIELDGDAGMTVVDIMAGYENEIKNADCAILDRYGPLHGEKWEYNKTNGQWCLIEQNQGFA